MAKTNYFDILASMCDILCKSFSGVGITKKQLLSMRKECLELTFRLESALLRDFLPPLERESIAELAYALCRAADVSAAHFGAIQISEKKYFLSLAEIIRDCARVLQEPSRLSPLPYIKAFRELQAKFSFNTQSALKMSAAFETYTALCCAFNTLVKIIFQSI